MINVYVTQHMLIQTQWTFNYINQNMVKLLLDRIVI